MELAREPVEVGSLGSSKGFLPVLSERKGNGYEPGACASSG